MVLQEDESASPASRSLWQRRATRRAVLMGSASVAAAGTAAAVVGVAAQGGTKGPVIPMLAATGSATAEPPAAPPAPSVEAPRPMTRQVDDPLKRAAHLLRRTGFGGSVAEIEAFARLSREEAADRVLNVVENRTP